MGPGPHPALWLSLCDTREANQKLEIKCKKVYEMHAIQLHCFHFDGNCYFFIQFTYVCACLCTLTETFWTTCVYKRWQRPNVCPPPPRACGTAPWLWGSSLGSLDPGRLASKVAALRMRLHWSIGSQNGGSRTFTHFEQLQPCRRGSPARAMGGEEQGYDTCEGNWGGVVRYRS